METTIRAKKPVIIRPKNRDEWLEYRKSGIGSSEVASIVGLNPFETAYQLWRRKLGLDPPKEESFAMKAGHYLEDAVSRFWQDETGNEIIKSSAGDWLMIDSDRDYMRVSPDRMYWQAGETHNTENKLILECKTTQRPIDGDEIPKHWFVQCQYQFGVAGIKGGSLAWLTQGREFGYRDLAFVPDFYGWLVEEVERFWTDNIQGRKEPEATSVQDVLLKYNRHTDGKVLEVSEEIYSACRELREVKKAIADAERDKEELEEKIKLAFADAEAISYGGVTLATFKAPKPSAKFDTKAFTAAHPDLAAEYTQTVQGARRFLLK